MKIKINNEEVVCDKNFTVSEEMLATSSVTLNNVYPKSWEETKDYVSNFYYPKDYSICKIYDETVIPYEPGTEVSGNPLYLTDVVASKIYQYKLYGYTKQTTYSGINLFENKTKNSETNKGITFTLNSDGTYTLNGTNDGTGNSFVWLSLSTDPTTLEAGTYYTIETGVSGVGMVGYTGSKYITLSANNKSSFTLTETTSMRVYLQVANGTTTTFNNFKMYPMISKTPITIDDYEPYVGGTQSPNPDYPQEVEVGRGKNLYNLTDGTYSANGIIGVVENGQIILNGTATANAFVNIPLATLLNWDTTKKYTVSCFNPVANSNVRLRVNSGGGMDTSMSVINANKTITPNNTDMQPTLCTIRVASGTALNDFVVKPMLEIGIYGTSYLPYNTIEVKSTGKNLIYDVNHNKGTSTTQRGITYTVNEDGSISVSGTATANYIYYMIGSDGTYPLTLEAGTYTLSGGISDNAWVRLFDGTNYYDTLSTGHIRTFTINQKTNFLVGLRIANGTTIDDTFYPMLEKGSSASEYEPYKETSIQYKLGDNFVADKDYIENGVLHKNIGKVVLNGSESGWLFNTNGTYGNIPYIRYSDVGIDNLIKKGTGTIESPRIPRICDHFSYYNTPSGFRDCPVGSLGFNSYGSNDIFFIFCVSSDSFADVNAWKTWLSNNPITVYYELAEETTVDLETEGELSLYDGINNVSADTDFTIDMLYNKVNGETIEDIIFNGLVKRTGNISLNPRDPHYCSLQVLDFKTFLSEGDVLNFVIANKTIEQAINMVVKAISSYGFVVGNIELDAKDDIIGAYSTDEKTAYDVFQYIADITNAKWFTRMIDEETIAIDFYDTDKLPNKGLIEYTNEWFCQNKIDDMSYSMDTNDYRNKQIILSDEVFGSTDYNETITATGYTTQFLTGGKIAKLNGATINSQTATIATNEEKEAGIEADIYYTPGENQFETAETQAQGIIIEISYTPLVKGREIVVNNEEVDRISSQLNRNGVISRYENRNDTTSSSELQQIGQSYIKYKGSPEITLKIVSRSNLYNVGDQVTFSSPLTELSTEYMVKKKSINYIATQSIIWYTFELSSNYNSESAINYFDNQRAKRAGNISESDYIIREIDINNTAQIKWQNTTITETTITGDNVLNAPLNAPLTQ